MNSARDRRLRELFEAALEHTGAAQDAFLTAQCGEDGELLAELRALLAGAADEHFLALTTAPGADAFERPGTQLGPYRLLELLGEGGFGRVFLAEQHEPVARRVALKVVKVGMDTAQVIRRFEHERQALARMDHPHIARVLDAGATSTGRPFFVMELVTGEPLTTFCDQRRLPIDQRLALFEQVCRAVQHAHSKGVVHRDLKPSNVLVTEHDGRPHAKVIDFGIAKAIASDRSTSLLTIAHQVLGTLQYMSPEQAEGSADVDTRADVYSLGVLLYELLTGTTPFATAGSAPLGLDDLRRQFRDHDPARPSTRVAATAATTTAIAAQRRSEPHRLGRQLRGDLDWITMKALERDRNRRYATVDGLAADLAAHRAGEPVVAAPPSAIYRLQKLLRRHATAFGSAVAVLLALLVGMLAFAWQAQIAAEERDTARSAQREAAAERTRATELAAAEAEQRLRAEHNAATAKAINQFLLRMLGAANVRELGRDATLVQALDHIAPAVGSTFGTTPEVAADVHLVLARSYLSLGRLEAADAQLQAAAALAQTPPDRPSPAVVEVQRLRGEWHVQRGENQRAAEVLREALSWSTAASGEQAPPTLALCIDLGTVLCDLDQFDQSEQMLQRGLAGLVAHHGPDHAETALAKCSLAVLRQSQGRLAEAAELYREVLAADLRLYGERHPDTLSARMNLATVLMKLGQKGEAMPMLDAAYTGLQKAYGDAHTTTALAAWQLAVHHYDEGHYAQALPLLERCVAIRRQTFGPLHQSTGKALELLALSTARLGNPQDAKPHFDAAVAAYTDSLGAHHPLTLLLRVHRANNLVRANDTAAGGPELLTLCDLCREHLDEHAPTTVIATNSYAVLLLGQGRYQDALPFLDQALAAGRASAEADPRDTVITQLNLVSALREVGRLGEAEPLGRSAVAELLEVFGPDHPTTAAGRSLHAETLRRLGKLAEARDQLEAALATRRAHNTSERPGHANEAFALARVRVELGEFEPAEQLLQDVRDSYRSAFGAQHTKVLRAEGELGALAGKAGRFAEGERALLDAEAALAAQLPQGRSDLQTIRRALADFYAAWQVAAPQPEREAAAADWRRRAQTPP
ncbi:MAG: tetratricopeptide repeat protein [Planctomycetes bacterium]|nr:tetratricopeptide repeat protein [Planctomycetota bacterium]